MKNGTLLTRFAFSSALFHHVMMILESSYQACYQTNGSQKLAVMVCLLSYIFYQSYICIHLRRKSYRGGFLPSNVLVIICNDLFSFLWGTIYSMSMFTISGFYHLLSNDVEERLFTAFRFFQIPQRYIIVIASAFHVRQITVFFFK